MSDPQSYHPWDPGLTSEIPARLMPLVTLYRAENADITYEQAKELRDIFGLSLETLATFNAKRLIVHHLLVRVTADFTLKDGPAYEELGISLRGMVGQIFKAHAEPKLAEFETLLDTVRSNASRLIEQELKQHLELKGDVEAVPQNSGFFSFLKPTPKAAPSLIQEEIELKALNQWQNRANNEEDALTQSCLTALHRVVGAQIGHRGRLIADHALIRDVCVRLVSNDYGAKRMGDQLDPVIDEAAKRENYRLLPSQEKPVIFNVKGASASGKSTIRGEQRAMAERLGVPWEDFALVSPDYWRKYLLDYESLGDDYKYGAMLTGRELEIIDRKLDHYMRQKARERGISHLLIDRFRFDSFSADPVEETSSRLLTRFGHTIYLFFMVTPPDALVERAWIRGQSTGRFKAVDDLLYHNIEAYTGMPNLFFSWVQSREKQVHFEFLDNSVPKGTKPITIAHGWNDEMNIYHIEPLLNISRFQKVNIEAKHRDELFGDDVNENQASLLISCIKRLALVRFIDLEKQACYAFSKDGETVKFSSSKALQGKVDQLKNILAESTLTFIEGEEDLSTEQSQMQTDRKHLVGSI